MWNFNTKTIYSYSEKINYFTAIAWILIASYIILFVILNPYSNTVTTIYWRASMHWIEGTDLYFRKGINVNSGFCYLPQAAILNIPLALLPFTVAEVIWRVINLLLLLYGCYCISRITDFKPSKISFFILSVITIPVSYDALRNGQVNITLISLLCISIYLIYKNKFNLAIILLLLGFILKPFLLIPLLLLCGIYPKKCLPTFIICLIIFILFPYLTQHFDYVNSQYKLYYSLLSSSSTYRFNRGYADLFGLLSTFQIKLNSIFIFLLSAILGLLIYFICLFYKFKKKSFTPILIFIFSVSYILLINKRTEFNTYCFAGPVIGYIICKSLQYKKYLFSVIFVISWIFIFSSHEICKNITPNEHSVWLAPLFYLIIFIFGIFLYKSKNKGNDFVQ